MLEYNEFKECMIKELQSKLPEDVCWELTSVKKNNDCEKEGITIKGGCNNVCPVIYFQDIYDHYMNGKEVSECLETVLELIHFNQKIQGLEVITNWEMVKNKVQIVIINRKWNGALLKEVPFQEFCDLAVVCRVIVYQDKSSRASCLVNREMLDKWGISEERLWNSAYSNLKDNLFYIRKMEDELSMIFDESYDNDRTKNNEVSTLYVMSNEYQSYGAAGLLRKDVIKELSDKIDSDLYILPSSIHELILIPVSEDINVNELKQMVYEINRQCVSSEERLSDEVYCYRKIEEKIEMA